MKNILSKIITLLTIFSLVIATMTIIWLLVLMKNIAINNNGLGGTFAFAFIALLVMSVLSYFLIKRSLKSPIDKEKVQGEEIQNIIKEKQL